MRELIETILTSYDHAKLVSSALGGGHFYRFGKIQMWLDADSGVSCNNCCVIHHNFQGFLKCDSCLLALLEYEAQYESHSHAADDLRG